MAQDSTISWTHHTFNPWLGCAKVTDACKFCYAEKFVERYGLAQWGVHGTRHITSAENWKKPVRWQKQAAKEGIRYRVFCASLADVFEDRPELIEPRERLWKLIEATPNLDWLILTKRPENLHRLYPERWLSSPAAFPRNIWQGVTMANQKDYDTFMPPLRKFCSEHFVNVMWISAEPLLGRITFDKDILNPVGFNKEAQSVYQKPLDWIIIGGESGPTTKIRKLDLYHVKHIFDQFSYSRKLCIGPAIFFKQVGAILAKVYKLHDAKGENMEELPTALSAFMVREFPNNLF